MNTELLSPNTYFQTTINQWINNPVVADSQQQQIPNGPSSLRSGRLSLGELQAGGASNSGKDWNHHPRRRGNRRTSSQQQQKHARSASS